MDHERFADHVFLERVESLDEARFTPLLEQSQGEGHQHLRRLADDWSSGANRFDRENEALFVAISVDRNSTPFTTGAGKTSAGTSERRWAGIVGLNIDPYLQDPTVGRLRRLYVAPEFRRHGIGRQLVLRVIEHARGRFKRLVLRTTPAAITFYEQIGFAPAPNATHYTHSLLLQDTMSSGMRRSGVPHGLPGSTLVRESWRDEAIREALEQGEFRDLPGKGKPLANLDDDPDWWVKDKLRREGVSVVPSYLQLRQEVARMREEITHLGSEELARRRIAEINAKIRAANRTITSGPPSDLAPLDEEEEISRWRATRR